MSIQAKFCFEYVQKKTIVFLYNNFKNVTCVFLKMAKVGRQGF